MVRKILLLLLLLAPSLARAAEAPSLSPAEARQLATAAGMSIQGSRVLNPCGHASSPQIRLDDLNGDGQPEAISLDRDPSCYGPDPGYQAKLLVRDARGQWQVMMAALGIFKPLATSTRGWRDISLEGPGCQPIWQYNGREYRAVNDCNPPPPAAAPAPSAATAGLSPAAKGAIFLAAGAERKRGRWIGCADAPEEDYTPAEIDMVRDINGDGRPEARVIFHGTFCYGLTGQGFVLLSQQADGSWRRITGTPGIATFLRSRGRDGWPDIEVGGPGFCFPVMRWNGRDYIEQRWEYDGKPCQRR